MSLQLEEIELIRRLKHRYSRGIDSGDMDLVASLFTEDAEIDYRGGSYHFALQGRDVIMEALSQAFHPRFVGSHTVHMPVIDVHDDGTADGEWTLLDYALDLDADNRTTVGSATYKDKYRKVDGEWLIARSSYERVYERVYHEPEPGLTAHLLARTGAAA
jgi:uncharacterized protein (TIGR02246 family)|tara:strand:- start:15420 stop:15899 length:480 start_codon:yes stop_codon:yes gene_type:complete